MMIKEVMINPCCFLPFHVYQIPFGHERGECTFQGDIHRKDLEIVPTLQALHLVMGVGGGCIQSETSQQAVEGCTHQRCLGKAEAASAQGGVYT